MSFIDRVRTKHLVRPVLAPLDKALHACLIDPRQRALRAGLMARRVTVRLLHFVGSFPCDSAFHDGPNEQDPFLSPRACAAL